MHDISLIMLAAGESRRLDMPTQKQFIRLGGEPLWLYATKNLASFYPFKKIIVTSSNVRLMQKFSNDYEIIKGGTTRSKSIKNALENTNSQWVMISDVARVNISKELFDNLINNINKADCISPALKVSDTVLYDDKIINRDLVKLIQTPQLSKTKLLKKALDTNIDFSDDSSAMASVGAKIYFVNGDEKARKITFKEDLKNIKLPSPSKDIFCGSGFDVHEYGENRPLILGGVRVHNDMGVKAHSDGDVIAHAMIDAILGASSLGDIGELYPDNDDKFKNANSMELLKQVYNKVLSIGFELINIDITIIAQKPKIGAFKDIIAKNIAKELNINQYQINIKATTTEKLGFIGRSEGIAVMANANLKYFDWKKYIWEY